MRLSTDQVQAIHRTTQRVLGVGARLTSCSKTPRHHPPGSLTSPNVQVCRYEPSLFARRLRNLLLHEYLSDTQLFLQALSTAREVTEKLFHTVNAIEVKAAEIGLRNTP